jgi:crotonobetainyl-CoA:carnitine CoA-transferase CaiB-like acyl-CoA transferase
MVKNVETAGALSGIRILDLSRVLAGPSCTQLLGDLGADVIKVERPGVGDETRTWGPPFVKDASGADTTESGYYLSCNRNKRSVCIDMAKPEGAILIKRLVATSDVLVENFKVGGLARFGLSYENLNEEFPRLIYCSITGFGQTGPYAQRPGYDLVVQGMGGLISMTGEPGRAPVKVPIAVNDVMTGLNAAVGILTALRHRDQTGRGQHIDLGLLDVQVGWLFNQGLNYLTGGLIPERLGTAHPNSVPYQAFECSDGWIVCGANNDEQFKRFASLIDRPELAGDVLYATNSARLVNRASLIPIIAKLVKLNTMRHWIDAFEAASLPCCPVNTLDQVFADPQVEARQMRISMPHPLAGKGSIDLIGSPIRLSETPPSYRRHPPSLGENTDEVLEEVLGLDSSSRAKLRSAGVI